MPVERPEDSLNAVLQELLQIIAGALSEPPQADLDNG